MKFWKLLLYSSFALSMLVAAFIGLTIFNSGKVKTKFSKKEMEFVLERSGLSKTHIRSVVEGFEYYMLGGDFEEKYCLQLDKSIDLDEEWDAFISFKNEERNLIQSMTNMSDGTVCLQTPLSQIRIKIIFADYRDDGRLNKHTGAISVYAPETGRLLYYAHKM